MSKLMDLTGERYGRLVVIERVADIVQPSGRRTRWLCVCDCGNLKSVLSHNLRRGNVHSCGCLNRDLVAGRNRERLFRPIKEQVGYSGTHRRIRTAKGNADQHPCVDCGEQAYEWSYDHSDPDELLEVQKGWPLAYSAKAEHYAPRCAGCHRAFDRRHRAEAQH